MIKFIILILLIFLNSCNYPNINEVPIEAPLDITSEDEQDLEELKKEINE